MLVLVRSDRVRQDGGVVVTRGTSECGNRRPRFDDAVSRNGHWNGEAVAR